MTTTNDSTLYTVEVLDPRSEQWNAVTSHVPYDRAVSVGFSFIEGGYEARVIEDGAMHGPSFSELLRASFSATYAAEQRLVFDGDDWTPETEQPYREAQRRHFALCQLAPGAFTAAW